MEIGIALNDSFRQTSQTKGMRFGKMGIGDVGCLVW